eukprot:scaffold10740_cov15-Tisochrysis_lutea.AAC.1
MANNERSRHLLPLTDSKECVEPNDTGIFNAIRQAESAASDPAITHCYARIASETFDFFSSNK